MSCRTLLAALWTGLFLHALGAPAHSQVAGPSGPPAYPLTSLVDSAALHAELATWIGPVPEGRHARLFSVRFDSAGQPETVEPTFAQLMPAGYAHVSSIIRRQLRNVAPSRSLQVYHLLVQAGPGPAIQMVELQQDPPRILNSREVQRALMRGVPFEDPRLRGPMTVLVRLLVDESGMPVDLQVGRSSGVDALDQVALAAAARFRFHPGRLEGIPMRVRVEIPMNYSFVEDEPASTPQAPARP